MGNKKICPDESIMKFLCNVYFGTEENIVRASRRAYLDFNRTIAFIGASSFLYIPEDPA